MDKSDDSKVQFSEYCRRYVVVCCRLNFKGTTTTLLRWRKAKGSSPGCIVYTPVGKTTVTEQPGYFVYGRGRWQGKKGRKIFWGGVCGKWGIVLFGVKSITAKVIKTAFMLSS